MNQKSSGVSEPWSVLEPPSVEPRCARYLLGRFKSCPRYEETPGFPGVSLLGRSITLIVIVVMGVIGRAASISTAAPTDQRQAKGDGNGPVDDPRCMTGHETPRSERHPQPLEYPDSPTQDEEGPNDDSSALHKIQGIRGSRSSVQSGVVG